MFFKKLIQWASFKKRGVVDYLIYSLPIALGILADAVTKQIALSALPALENKSFTLIDGVFSFTLHFNRGAAWGILKGAPWVFNTISIIAVILIIAFLYLGKASSRIQALGLALIASGGIGNLIERLSKGYVTDFLHATFIDFPIFNVADCLVCIGAGVLILWLVLEIVKEAKQTKAKAKDEPQDSYDSDEVEK